MKKRKARLRGTKTAAKSEQKKLLQRLKSLRENPSILIPKIKGSNEARKIYDKVLKELELAKDQYENPPGFMSKFFGSRPKDQLAKAYGASLTVLDSGAPVMAIARFPHGEVNYVLRGSGVSKEKLIGVQNHHSRLWSRFSHLDYVKKYKLYIYALEEGLICTGTKPSYPVKLWSEVCSTLKLKDSSNVDYGVKFACNSLGKDVTIPSKRIMKSKDNSYSIFLRNQISYDQDSDFTLSATTRLSEVVKDLPYGIFEKYRKGEETDSQVWNRIIDYQKDEIENSNGKYFVIGDETVDESELTNKLATNSIDKEIIQDVLANLTDSVFLNQATFSSFVDETWDSHGKNLAEKILSGSSDNYNGENAHEILRELYNQIVSESLTKDYPQFPSLSEPLKNLDKVVRLLKTGEKEKAVKFVDDHSSNNNMTKSVSWAILICLGATSSRAWKYSKEEQALGESLKSQIQKLMDSDPSGYLEILEDISSRIGLGNKLEVI
tara:strand:- start:914 stop:2392 length:1479 start_codon:yes stop_codon:yes gene_type:complete